MSRYVALYSLFVLASMGTCFTVMASEVHYAGFAYSGDFQSIQSRFPFTTQIIPPRSTADSSGPSAVERELLARARVIKPTNFELVTDSLASLEGRDQAILVALVATGETVSTERIDDYTKLYINLRAQALFFDFKTMTVLRAYPISVVFLGDSARELNRDGELARVRELLLGGEKPGVFGHFLERLRDAVLPGPTTRLIGVDQVSIAPVVAATLPAYLAADGVAEAWLADNFSETLMDKTGVSLLPFAKGYAIGNTMATRLADGTVFNLKIPRRDYSISLDLQSLKKIKFADVPAGSSFIYGAFVHLLVQEPLLQHRYLDATFKNGETKTVPARQATVDDWPAYQDAIAGLFEKFASALDGSNAQWLKSSVTTLDVTSQMAATKTVLNSCH